MYPVNVLPLCVIKRNQWLHNMPCPFLQFTRYWLLIAMKHGYQLFLNTPVGHTFKPVLPVLVEWVRQCRRQRHMHPAQALAGPHIRPISGQTDSIE